MRTIAITCTSQWCNEANKPLLVLKPLQASLLIFEPCPAQIVVLLVFIRIVSFAVARYACASDDTYLRNMSLQGGRTDQCKGSSILQCQAPYDLLLCPSNIKVKHTYTTSNTKSPESEHDDFRSSKTYCCTITVTWLGMTVVCKSRTTINSASMTIHSRCMYWQPKPNFKVTMMVWL